MQKVFEIINENPDTIVISESVTEETESVTVSRIVILRCLTISVTIVKCNLRGETSLTHCGILCGAT